MVNSVKSTVSADPEALTELILTMFRTNNALLTWGDRIVSTLGLTSARWQILGAIVQADQHQPVAWLARDLGANRQNVQRIVNDLRKEKLVSLEPNPHHKRAHLVVLTTKGQKIYDAAIALYGPRVKQMAQAFPAEDIAVAQRVLLALRTGLQSSASET